MKKRVKQYTRQIEAGALDYRNALKDFSRMLDSQVIKLHLRGGTYSPTMLDIPEI